MKKRFIVCIFAIALTLFATGYAEGRNTTFTFPKALKIIEDEAFEGTSVKTVILPDGLQYIGERAFDKIETLRKVYIPESAVYIADTAFYKGAAYTVYGIRGSYAEDWAKKHRVPFKEADIWRTVLPKDQHKDEHSPRADMLLWTYDPFEPDRTYLDTIEENVSHRIEDRPEFYPIDYRFP